MIRNVVSRTLEKKKRPQPQPRKPHSTIDMNSFLATTTRTTLPSWGEPILPQIWKSTEEEINLKFPLPSVSSTRMDPRQHICIEEDIDDRHCKLQLEEDWDYDYYNNNSDNSHSFRINNSNNDEALFESSFNNKIKTGNVKIESSQQLELWSPSTSSSSSPVPDETREESECTNDDDNDQDDDDESLSEYYSAECEIVDYFSSPGSMTEASNKSWKNAFGRIVFSSSTWGSPARTNLKDATDGHGDDTMTVASLLATAVAPDDTGCGRYGEIQLSTNHQQPVTTRPRSPECGEQLSLLLDSKCETQAETSRANTKGAISTSRSSSPPCCHKSNKVVWIIEIDSNQQQQEAQPEGIHTFKLKVAANGTYMLLQHHEILECVKAVLQEVQPNDLFQILLLFENDGNGQQEMKKSIILEPREILGQLREIIIQLRLMETTSNSLKTTTTTMNTNRHKASLFRGGIGSQMAASATSYCPTRRKRGRQQQQQRQRPQDDADDQALVDNYNTTIHCKKMKREENKRIHFPFWNTRSSRK